MNDLLTIKEAAAQIKVSDRTIRRWIADGRLDASKIARTVRIRRQALEALTQTDPNNAKPPSHHETEALAASELGNEIAPAPRALLSAPSSNQNESQAHLSKQAAQAPTTSKPLPDLQTILSTLRQQLPFLRTQYDVHLLGVFGSFRRGEQTPTSDLDLLVAFRETPGLLKYIELEHYLSDLVGIKVDLVMGDALKSRIGEHAQEEVALV